MLDEGGMRAVVSSKEERREGGSSTGTRAWDREPIGGKRTVHEDGECSTISWPRENMVLMGLTQTASAGHAETVTRSA